LIHVGAERQPLRTFLARPELHMRFARTARQLLTLLILLPACRSRGQQVAAAPNDPKQFAGEIEAFTAWDAKNAAPRDPIVFAGGSSIRLWNTAERFKGLPIVNRGFGGAQLSDVNVYIKETVLRYAPRIVVLYAGDNDINAGKSTAQLFTDYQAFVNAVHGADSTVDIVFIAIKPSLARWALWPRMRAANDSIRTWNAAHPRLHYVDIATPMLGPDGKPRPELFVADGLHLSSAGYDGWTSGVAAMLATLPQHAPRP
jgi:lysophospholipase L1-like esterase